MASASGPASGERRVERLTLDTNLPRAIWKEDEPERVHVEALLELAGRGLVDLAVTAYIEDDIPVDPLRSRIRELPSLGVDVYAARVAVLGEWVLGRDFLGSEPFEELRREVQAMRRPGDRKLPGPTDWFHLHAHLAHGRDVFLTWDRAILDLAPTLLERLGVRVMKPEDYLSTR
jgi:hypothetical protein